MSVLNFAAPHTYHRVKVTTTSGSRRERVHGDGTTYTYQLRAFAAAIGGDDSNRTPPADSVVTMELIDDIYRAAGLSPRGDCWAGEWTAW